MKFMPQLSNFLPHTYKHVWHVMLLVGVLQAAYAASFIYRTSCVVEGQRYFCLFDDAMISMRHADNWANGHGFVWNPGERVEGYTNFGWTFLMGLLHLLRLSPSHTCLLVQILGIPILWTCLFATVKLARACQLTPIATACAVIMAGGYYNLIFFTMFGMETGLLTALIALALAGGVRCIRLSEGSVAPMLWFAPAMLVRPDAIVFLLITFFYLLIFVRRGRWKILAGFGLVVAVVMVHLLWRHSFYGEWLPNTYYLKATGWPLSQRLIPGFTQTAKTILGLGIPFLFAIITILTGRRKEYLLLFLIFAGGAGYQFYVGGDAWPRDRMVIPSVIGLIVLAAEGVYRSTLWLFNGRTRLIARIFPFGMAIFSILAINARQWHEWMSLVPYSVDENVNNIRYTIAMQKIAEPQATVALGYAGAVPYFSKRQSFDFFGKCDPYIARLPAHEEVQRAGHNKFDHAYTIATYMPDIILQGQTPEIPVFERNYHPIAVKVDEINVPLCVRKNSRWIHGGRPLSWKQAYVMMKELLLPEKKP
jgi:arabinofuranosyltransferase